MPQQIHLGRWVKLKDGSKKYISDVDLKGDKSPVGHFAVYLTDKPGEPIGKWVGTDQIERVMGKTPYSYPAPVDLGVASWSNTTKQINEILDQAEKEALIRFIQRARQMWGGDEDKIKLILMHHGLTSEEIIDLMKQSLKETEKTKCYWCGSTKPPVKTSEEKYQCPDCGESGNFIDWLKEASKSIEKDVEKDDVDQAQLKRGIEIEYEHTDDWKLAEKIALDHLAEIPDYYTRLDNMEKQADKEGMKNEMPDFQNKEFKNYLSEIKKEKMKTFKQLILESTTPIGDERTFSIDLLKTLGVNKPGTLLIKNHVFKYRNETWKIDKEQTMIGKSGISATRIK